MKSINPATGEVVKEYREHSWQDVETALSASRAAFERWRGADFSARADCMKRASTLLAERKGQFAELMAIEMGKPVKQGRAEIEKCALACTFYAERAEAFLSPLSVQADAQKSYVAFQPLGTVLAVMPWNFPFWQVFRFTAPSLMAGNAAILKHAANVPGCAMAIEAIFGEAGFPSGLFRSLLVDSEHVARIIERPEVAAVTLTGSTRAGKAVASAAGTALKKTVLELGGSDPYVVLEDADLDGAVEICASSRLINGGQSCIAAKRFIVVGSQRAAFETKLAERMGRTKVGDPRDEHTDMGPLAREDLRDALHRQVTKSIEAGARVVLGGTIPDKRGAWYPPTVLTDVQSGMPAYDEELFGPVAAVIAARDEEDAIAKANDTAFGLGAAVFTRDIARGERVAKEIDAGNCFVNALVKSDPRLPFGGIKESGYGRELSEFGIREFVNIKTVYVA